MNNLSKVLNHVYLSYNIHNMYSMYLSYNIEWLTLTMTVFAHLEITMFGQKDFKILLLSV